MDECAFPIQYAPIVRHPSSNISLQFIQMATCFHCFFCLHARLLVCCSFHGFIFNIFFAFNKCLHPPSIHFYFDWFVRAPLEIPISPVRLLFPSIRLQHTNNNIRFPRFLMHASHLSANVQIIFNFVPKKRRKIILMQCCKQTAIICLLITGGCATAKKSVRGQIGEGRWKINVWMMRVRNMMRPRWWWADQMGRQQKMHVMCV